MSIHRATNELHILLAVNNRVSKPEFFNRKSGVLTITPTRHLSARNVHENTIFEHNRRCKRSADINVRMILNRMANLPTVKHATTRHARRTKASLVQRLVACRRQGFDTDQRQRAESTGQFPFASINRARLNGTRRLIVAPRAPVRSLPLIDRRKYGRPSV